MIQFQTNSVSISSMDSNGSLFSFGGLYETQKVESENLKDRVTGFAKSWGVLIVDLYRGCRNIVQQSLLTDGCYIVRKFGRQVAKVSGKLGFLNEYLPEDRDPVIAWPVVFFAFFMALVCKSHLGLSLALQLSVLCVLLFCLMISVI